MGEKGGKTESRSTGQEEEEGETGVNGVLMKTRLQQGSRWRQQGVRELRRGGGGFKWLGKGTVPRDTEIHS